jgi:transcription antitermination protein NusB
MSTPNPSVAKRSAARLAAVQALYSMEMTGVDCEQALKEAKERAANEPRGRLADPDSSLLNQLVRGVSAQVAELDVQVSEALSGDWNTDRLEAVLRAIVRAGAWELSARPQTPARVCISEWVDVAHAFYSGPEPGLVNAVLDRLAQTLRGSEMGKGS